MEMFGILFSIPVAFAASVIYSMMLIFIVKRFPRLSQAFWWASVIVLAGFLVEVILLVTLGAVQSRGILGPGFYGAHTVIFFLGTPALANLLLLRRQTRLLLWSCITVVLCTTFALGLVILQYGVSEALYGIDGEGPYSARPAAMQPVGSKPWS